MNKNMIKSFLFLSFFVFAGYVYAENCYTLGFVQYKVSGCDTIERTCCSTTKTWSDWGEACPTCSPDQCWNGSDCIDKEEVTRSCLGNIANSTGGTQTRTASCKLNSGWDYTSWSGTCTCKNGYKWFASSSSCLSNYKVIKKNIYISGGCGYSKAPTSVEEAKQSSAEQAAWMASMLKKKGEFGIPKEEDCVSEGYVSSIIEDDTLYVDCQDGTYEYKYLRADYYCRIR